MRGFLERGPGRRRDATRPAAAGGAERAPRLAVIGLVGVVIALGALQWHLANEVTRLERQRARKSLSEAGERIAEGLDREILRAMLYFHFGPFRGRRSARPIDVAPGEGSAGDGSSGDSGPSLSRRLALWREAAPDPELIRAVYLAAPEAASLARCDAARRACFPAPWPAELSAARSRIARGLQGPEIEPGAPALLLPLPLPSRDEFAAPRPTAILLLDRAYLRDQLLPQLVERNLFLSRHDELRVAVVEPRGVLYRSVPGFEPVAGKGDLWIPMLELRDLDDVRGLWPHRVLHGRFGHEGGEGREGREEGADRSAARGRWAFLHRTLERPAGGSGTWTLVISHR